MIAKSNPSDELIPIFVDYVNSEKNTQIYIGIPTPGEAVLKLLVKYQDFLLKVIDQVVEQNGYLMVKITEITDYLDLLDIIRFISDNCIVFSKGFSRNIPLKKLYSYLR